MKNIPIRNHAAGVLLAAAMVMSGGCVALVAGAGAGGTVFWQGGKAITEEKVSMTRAGDAVKSVFRERQIKVTEEVSKTKATQFRGLDKAGEKVAVDVIAAGEDSVRLEVRVGLADKSAARDLLQDIKDKL